MVSCSPYLNPLLLALSTPLAEQKVLRDEDGRGRAGPFDEGFRRLACETLGLWGVPGVAVGVVDGGEVFVEVCMDGWLWRI